MARNNHIDDDLVALHEKLCKAFAARLDNGEKVNTKDGVETVDCSAATLREIRQFLADNDIQGVLKAGTPLDNLTRKLPFPGKENT